jgi:hypothetical protein
MESLFYNDKKSISRDGCMTSMGNGCGRSTDIKLIVRVVLLLMISSWSDWIAATELVGRTVTGSLFSLSVESKKRNADSQEFSNDIIIMYRSENVEPARKYKLATRAPVLVSASRLGLVLIGERVGGMNGSYSIMYLVPEPDGLKHLGSVDVSMNNGKVLSVTTEERRWDVSLGATERKAWLDRVVSRAEKQFLSDKSSTDDAFLLFAVPELTSRLMSRIPHFADRYSEYLISNVDSSVGNLIRRRFVGNNRSLCDDEQFDVFVCRTNQQIVSLCLDERDGLKRLEYRFGDKNNIALKLSKTINTKYDVFDLNTSFSRGPYAYIIKDGNSGTPSVLVEENGLVISEKLCSGGNIEAIIFPVR